MIADFENSDGGDQDVEILLANREGAGVSWNCTEIKAVSFEKVIILEIGSFWKLTSLMISPTSFLLRMVFDTNV